MNVEKRAKIIAADGELQASEKLAQAAQVLGSQKDAITLRYLETMRDVSTSSNNSTTFFPIPIEILNNLFFLFRILMHSKIAPRSTS